MERKFFKVIGWLIFLPLFIACSTSFKVTSNPEKASIYFYKGDQQEKVRLGETPFEKSDEELSKEFGEFGKPGELVKVSVEKENYVSQSFWLPVSNSGVVSSEVMLKLIEDKKQTVEISSAEKALDQLFLAQRFALTNEFERALIEIDKVLNNFPRLARALSMKASIYYAKGDFKESLNWYEKAIEANPQLREAVEMSALVRKKLRLPAASSPISTPDQLLDKTNGAK